MNSYKKTKIFDRVIFATIGFLICVLSDAQVNLKDVTIQQIPNGRTDINLVFEVDSGYYVQSDRPWDKYLIPTEFTVTNCTGLEILQIDFLPRGGKDNVSLDDHQALKGTFVVTLRTINIAGNKSIRGVLDFQACNDRQCFFPRKKVVDVSFPALKLIAGLDH